MTDKIGGKGVFFASVCKDVNATFDVIFIHGVDGSPIDTWTHEGCLEPDGGYWPTWLGKDIPTINVFTLGHNHSLWKQIGKSEYSMAESAKAILDIFESYSIGKRPIALVCHSLGGLIAKQIIRTALESENEKWIQIAEMIKLVCFIATPHHGSDLAGFLSAIGSVFSSQISKFLTAENLALEDLSSSFKAFANKGKCKTVAYYEKLPMKGVAVAVGVTSSDPGVANCSPIPLMADHTSICKPSSRNDQLYLGVKNHITTVVDGLIEEGVLNETKINGYAALHQASVSDRRTLLQKLIAANREPIYGVANERQNRFAQTYQKYGLHQPSRKKHDKLLSEIEQRFTLQVWESLICHDADEATVAEAVQTLVIDPVVTQLEDVVDHPSSFVLDALYFLTERCHIRWDHD